MHGLALCYGDGLEVERNLHLERFWYEKASSGGHRLAQLNLGVGLLEGKAGKRDPVRAFQLFHLSAMQEEASAMYNLGLCYSKRWRG